jgi:hypothetical protein
MAKYSISLRREYVLEKGYLRPQIRNPNIETLNKYQMLKGYNSQKRLKRFEHSSFGFVSNCSAFCGIEPYGFRASRLPKHREALDG